MKGILLLSAHLQATRQRIADLEAEMAAARASALSCKASMQEELQEVQEDVEKLTTSDMSTVVSQSNREASGKTTRREDAGARPASSHDNDYSGRGPLPPQHLVAFAMAAHQRLGAVSPWAEMSDDVLNHVALELAAAAAREQAEERKRAQEAHRWDAAPVYTYENWSPELLMRVVVASLPGCLLTGAQGCLRAIARVYAKDGCLLLHLLARRRSLEWAGAWPS